MDKNILKAFYHSTVREAARRLSISDWEWKSVPELYDELRDSNPKVYKAVRDFFKAYDAWYKIHESIEIAGSAGKLSEDEEKELNAAIEARDKTRHKLIQSLRES